MASYFVASHAPPGGKVAVHDRSRCPPACFLLETSTEYLGEFLEASQALAVARLRYAHAHGCPCVERPGVPWPRPRTAAQPIAPR